MYIFPIPARSDNYIWIISHPQGVVVVDPSEAKPVLAYLAKNSQKPTAILLTHNHHDHTDGVADIIAHYPDLPVYGPLEAAAFITQQVEPDQLFSLFGLSVKVIKSAGHTAGHISYLLDNQHLFCGDALFSAGCGRVFTGDYVAQFETLARFGELDDRTIVYPAHEYTQHNLRFALKVLPSSCLLLEHQERVDILRAENCPTLPTTIGLEKQINPFMQAVSLAEFIALRQQRDEF
ncbi:hydroxyacylglutathione hydrolase [Nicoletella semolina]|uniref:Hydroxyacylglutathione hydrolase n=1 Tax=Nicoletella semolina TaxID=271160 RepID=A0A4R2NA39_9PAST|nr:hydroxyacylglutathione hydrolase [Nicoletella semolina]MDH2925374.1 hydroxyacylglutathione hydrolase [Nicoletella semolina]TCP17852.1 hydroxyacylglutathione hydrolase [Nicoletella semolina]